VVLNGSRIEGLANSESDLDAWVITSGEQHQRRVPVFDRQGGLHLNMSSYREEMVRELVMKLNAMSSRETVKLATIPANTLDRYYRVCSAQAVINAAGFLELQSLFSRDHFADLFVVWTGLHAVMELDKARHALDMGRPEQALLCARRAAEAAVDHVAAMRGEVYPSLKWRFEKLARCVGETSPAYAEAWGLKAPGSRGALEYIDAVQAYAKRAGALDYPVVPSQLMRAPSTEAFLLAGRWYLVQGKAVLFELSDTGRWLWERLDGTRTELDLIAEYEAAFPSGGRGRAAAAAFLARALDLGLANHTTNTLF